MKSKDTRSEAQKELDEYRRTGEAYYNRKDDETIEAADQDPEPQRDGRSAATKPISSQA